MAGLSKLKAAQEDRKARAAASGGGSNAFFKVPQDGEERTRILETLDDILARQSAYFHAMEPQGNRKYTWFEVCLDQDPDGNRIGAECPGCEANREDWEICKRKLILYANVIWRNAPVRKKNDKGKWEDTDERKDQLAVWEISQTSVQDGLEQAHLTYKDLTTRDFLVSRTGTGFDTKYFLNPATNDEGDAVKTPLSEDDLKLVEEKEDLSGRVALKDLADWGKTKAPKKDGDGGGSSSAAASDSPFLRRNREQPEG